MSGTESRYELDRAVEGFRLERVRLIREGREEAAAELSARAAESLDALAKEARKVRGIDDDAPSSVLHARLVRAPEVSP